MPLLYPALLLLLLFFTPLHFLLVVEPGSDSVTNTKADISLKRDLCQAHVPAPLGDNHELFLQLIRDISKRNGQT